MLIAYCSVSCDKHLPVIEDGAVESVSISLRNVGYVSTKSVAHTAEESAVSSLDVFVFRDGALEAHGRVSGASSVSGLKVSHGAKTVWAFANFSTERMNVIQSLSDAVSFASQYSENSRTSFVMRGSKNITVSSSETSFTMSVTRDVSKVIIDAAPVFTGTAAGGTLEGIYLINIPKTFDEDAVLTSSDGANAWNFDNTVASSPDGSACSYATGSSSWSSALYGMPNASPESADADTKDYVTKCVLKATVQGLTYWYPVGIPDMQANKCYSISNIVINRPGSDNPNSYLTEESLSVSITVSPWDEGEMTGHYNDGIYAAPRGYHMGHEWVDLGLRETIDGVVYKVLFATSNIGASSETDYGDYFAWGETSKRYTSISESTIVGGTFEWSNAPYRSSNNWTKYTIGGDDLTNLESSDDVASVLWGGSWRMPDRTELEYLISSSVDYNWTNVNGVSGFKVSGKGDYSSIVLFLPGAGYASDSMIDMKGGYIGYWSRTLNSDVSNEAYILRQDEIYSASRYRGSSVRPVYVVPDHTNPMNIAANAHDYVDLGLRRNGKKILFATCNIGASSPEEYGDYFAWGEISKHYNSITDHNVVGGSFDWAYTPYSNADGTKFTKYTGANNSYAASGTADGLTSLALEDDAAHVLWGGNWHMPDKEDFDFLNSSNVTCTYINNYNGTGVSGSLLKGTGVFSSASIFIPDSGYIYTDCIDFWGTRSHLLSRSLSTNNPNYSYSLEIDAGYRTCDAYDRYVGKPIRPVLEVDIDIPTFAGYTITSGPLYYTGSTFEINDSWKYNSYNSKYGKTSGSSYFNYLEMGSLFEKSSFSTSDGDIDNLCDPFDGYRLPTQSDWNNILFNTGRAGSVVNGVSGYRFTFVFITDSDYASNQPQCYGYIIFPDGFIINGRPLNSKNNVAFGSQTQMTEEQLDQYIAQGCVFLPFGNSYIRDESQPWKSATGMLGYWSSTQSNTNNGYFLGNEGSSFSASSAAIKNEAYFLIRLIKPIL